MTERRIDNPIINSPFTMPDRHFRFDDEAITEDIVDGRRPSAYFTAIPPSKRRTAAQQELVLQEWTKDRLKESEFVNQLRERVAVWRQLGYPHVTGTTRRLLAYWVDPDRERKLFFAQVEALETLIFLADAAAKEPTPRPSTRRTSARRVVGQLHTRGHSTPRPAQAPPIGRRSAQQLRSAPRC